MSGAAAKKSAAAAAAAAIAEEQQQKTVFIRLKTEPGSTRIKKEIIGGDVVMQQPQQQIYIIQTTDGSIPMEGTEVVVSEDMAVYETVSALEQLSRGQVITTTGDDGSELMVYEEVVLPDEGSGSIVDQFVDVQEVEVGDGRSASPVKIETVSSSSLLQQQGGQRKARRSSDGNASFYIPLASGGGDQMEFGGEMTDLHCPDCGKLFKSKRSLFGHKKEKHTGVSEIHHCPECGKSFGRKSNLKAHRESLHYGKKFPCSYCERVFTNRSSMNQHIKKTHVITSSGGETFVVQQE